MAGFNFQPGVQAAPAGPTMPFQLLPPQLLAQIAQAAFRPPGGGGGMDMGGGGGAARPPGMNFGGVGQGLGALAGAIAKNRGTGGAPGPGAMPGEDRATAPQWPPPMGDSTSTVQPLTQSNGQGGSTLGMQDFWSGKWLPTLGFSGSGSAAVSPTFTGGGSSGFGG